MAARHSRKLLRPLLYTSAAAAAGAGVLYISYRPRNIPGLEAPAVPPPGYHEGKLVPPSFPSIKGRIDQIKDLKRSQTEEPYDLLVIGGGATGSGIALDAATRGLRVAVVERDDFSAGTSSKSTKLVHGGVRYLEKAFWELDYNQYALVKEALRERKYFLNTAPHLSQWLPIMVPVQKWWQIPYFWGGCKAYDLLAGSEGIESSYFLTKSKAIDAFPMLKRDDVIGAMVYYDGAHNDSRMNVSLAMTAALYGSTVVNHMEVTGLTKGEDGKLNGAILRDVIPGKDGEQAEEFKIRAKGIINATGPFTDSIRKMDDPSIQEIVAPSSGVHIILPGYFSPSNMGLIDPSTSDGRVIFFLPWQGNTIAGTTDAPTEITYQPEPSEKDIQWILNEIRGYFAPDITVDRKDVLAAWSGIRPLVRDPAKSSSQALVRNHLISVSPSGLLTCAGGKWTTYRQMAEEAVDEAIEAFHLQPRELHNMPDISGAGGSGLVADGATLDGSCQTHQVRLIGAHGFSQTLFINLIQHFGLETDVAKHLTTSYGDRAWQVAALSSPTNTRYPVRGCRISALYPFVDGEVRYAVRHEYAQTAVDVIARRTRLAFLNAEAALEALPNVIDLMAEELKAEAEEEDLRRQRKKIKRESMGLGPNQPGDSPPMRPTPSRRLSETSAATTLAFFKQQSPPEPRQTPLPPLSRTPQPPPHLMHPQSQHPSAPRPPSATQHSHSQAHPSQTQPQHQQPHQHPHPHHSSHQHQAPHLHPHSHPHPHSHQHPHQHQGHQHQSHQHHHQHHNQHHQSVNSQEQMNGTGSVRRKQKYTIKNVEAWGERHGRPAAHDPSGRALWKRPSDGSLVYLTCPIQGCGKSDFVTLHGFMCHLTKKHKDRTLGSQSRALEMCGVIYDPNAPLPPVQASNRASMEDSPLEGGVDDEGHDHEMDSEPEDSEESREEMYRMKTEASERHMLDGQRTPESQNASPIPARPTMSSSNKPSISSIIDRTPDSGSGRETLSSVPSSDSLSQGLTPVSMEQSVPLKRKYEYSPEKENTEPRLGSASD